MSNPFLGEIRMFSFDFPPKGWARCNGALLAINQNTALFSLLGTQYGGDGITTFALPDLRDRGPMHVDSSGGTNTIGEKAGEATHTLSLNEIPAHTHLASGRGAATTGSPDGAMWATATEPAYASTPNTAMAPVGIQNDGGSQPHENRPPFLVVQFGIALQGIFPSRN